MRSTQHWPYSGFVAGVLALSACSDAAAPPEGSAGGSAGTGSGASGGSGGSETDAGTGETTTRFDTEPGTVSVVGSSNAVRTANASITGYRSPASAGQDSVRCTFYPNQSGAAAPNVEVLAYMGERTEPQVRFTLLGIGTADELTATHTFGEALSQELELRVRLDHHSSSSFHEYAYFSDDPAVSTCDVELTGLVSDRLVGSVSCRDLFATPRSQDDAGPLAAQRTANATVQFDCPLHVDEERFGSEEGLASVGTVVSQTKFSPALSAVYVGPFPEAATTEGLEILSARFDVDSIGGVTWFATVRNTFDEWLCLPDLNVLFLDAKGNELFEDIALVDAAEPATGGGNCLASGAIGVAATLLQTATRELAARVTTVEWSYAFAYRSTSEVVDRTLFANLRVEADEFGRPAVAGTLQNQNTFALQYLTLSAFVLNEGGMIVDELLDIYDGTSLASGAEWAFHTYGYRRPFTVDHVLMAPRYSAD